MCQCVADFCLAPRPARTNHARRGSGLGLRAADDLVTSIRLLGSFRLTGSSMRLSGIADDVSSDIKRAKLRVATRKWMIGRLAPKKYGGGLTYGLSDPGGKGVQPAIIVRIGPAASPHTTHDSSSAAVPAIDLGQADVR
jgi:hypothetical protein